jgi:signal transduction histidine kinase
MPSVSRFLASGSVARRYGFAVAACGAAAGLSAFLLVAPGHSRAIAVLLAAILVTGWYAGAGPAVLSLVLCLAIDRLLPSMLGLRVSFAPALRDTWFVAFALAAARFGTVRRRMEAELVSAREGLERQVAARTEELRRIQKYLAEAERLSQTGCWAIPVGGENRRFFFSAETYRIFGLDPAGGEPSLDWWASVLHPADRERILATVRTAIAQGRNFGFYYRLVRPTGEVRQVRSEGQPYVDSDGRVHEYIGVLMDVTDRRRAGRALRRARERAIQERFAARLAERNRLAREMHDTLLQGFTGVSLKLLAATNRIRAPREDVEELRQVLALAQRSLQEAREAVWDMRTSTPERCLRDSLREMAERVTTATRPVELEFEADGDERLDPEAAAAVMRVAREALINAVRHSGAPCVRVRLRQRPKFVRLMVSDRGLGFVVETDQRSYGGHWGLLGMHERAAQVGGRLRLRSAPGRGTTVAFTVPVRPRRRPVAHPAAEERALPA